MYIHAELDNTLDYTKPTCPAFLGRSWSCVQEKSVIWEKFRSDLIQVYKLDLQQPGDDEMLRPQEQKQELNECYSISNSVMLVSRISWWPVCSVCAFSSASTVCLLSRTAVVSSSPLPLLHRVHSITLFLHLLPY